MRFWPLMHQNAFVGRALPGPVGWACSAHPDPLAGKAGAAGGEGEEGKEGREEREEGRTGEGLVPPTFRTWLRPCHWSPMRAQYRRVDTWIMLWWGRSTDVHHVTLGCIKHHAPYDLAHFSAVPNLLVKVDLYLVFCAMNHCKLAYHQQTDGRCPRINGGWHVIYIKQEQ